MDLDTHGPKKYPTSGLLGSSTGRGWRNIFAELRAHPPCHTPVVAPRRTEIIIAIIGSTEGHVIRTGAGVRQCAMPAHGKIWLSPVGIDDNTVHITAPLPQALHLFLAPETFSGLATEYQLPHCADHAVRYAAGVDDALILQLGRNILTELQQESAAGDMLVETAAMLLAARLAQCHGDGWQVRMDGRRRRLDPARLRRTLDYIEAHLDEDLSIDLLAQLCYMSTYHFARMFSAATGMPPHRYVANRRLHKSRRLLAAGQLGLAEIAQIARFSNQASFTRAFTRETGISPGEYRRQAR